jgi:hypothetical protein
MMGLDARLGRGAALAGHAVLLTWGIETVTFVLSSEFSVYIIPKTGNGVHHKSIPYAEFGGCTNRSKSRGAARMMAPDNARLGREAAVAGHADPGRRGGRWADFPTEPDRFPRYPMRIGRAHPGDLDFAP